MFFAQNKLIFDIINTYNVRSLTPINICDVYVEPDSIYFLYVCEWKKGFLKRKRKKINTYFLFLRWRGQRM